jgi:hypothetical protein
MLDMEAEALRFAKSGSMILGRFNGGQKKMDMTKRRLLGNARLIE